MEPDFAEALFNLGATLNSLGRRDEARACYEQVLVLLIGMGDALAREGKEAEAIEFYQRALDMRPDHVEVLVQAGVLLDSQGRHEEAVQYLRRALKARPGDADAAYNLGIVLHGLGEYAAAVDSYDTARRAAPERGDAALGRALSLLTMGDYVRGFQAYEARHKGGFEKTAMTAPDFAFPMWRGEPLAGKRILLVGEQGFGDQIQFIRYASVLARQGAAVDVAADARLHRLFANAAGVRKVQTAVARRSADYDFWSLLLSLPLHLGTTADTVPAEVPYLRPPEEDVKKWAARLRGLPPERRRVGLVWIAASNPGLERKHGRSMPFEALAPLARVANASFIGLQFGAPAGEGAAAAGFPALNLGAEIGDFADNAALLANLDLLVTVDTAAGHLAGALGIPAWIMLPATPDWRWMRGRADSPWYPTVKLLRQEKRGEWAPVIERVARDLGLIESRPRG